MGNEKFLYMLLGVFILAGIIHLFFYLVLFRRFSFFKLKDKDGIRNPVSVIVAAKNELINLRSFLPSLLEQAYPDYEVIVVNDGSWDDTANYLEEMKLQHNHLKIVTIPDQDKYKHGKKFALTLGIKAAKNDVLLFTDADCMAVSPNWISQIQKHFDEQIEIVLGYGGYQKEKSFLNKLIRYDTFRIALQYFSFALSRNAYMGVGRNLAYRKSLFFRTKGFAKHNHIYSGDDDLFVNQNASPGNVAIEIHPDSITRSVAKRTFNEWMEQKRRHGATSLLYKPQHKKQLAALHLSDLVFFLLLITLLILSFQWKAALLFYLLKLLAEWTISFKAAKKLNEKDLMWLYPLNEIIITFLQPVFYISSLFTKQKAWK